MLLPPASRPLPRRRPDPSAQRVDVVVSIGEATLTLTDHAERALAHWSLAALHRKNPSKRPALYAPSEADDEAEELELSDDDMILAIDGQPIPELLDH